MKLALLLRLACLPLAAEETAVESRAQGGDLTAATDFTIPYTDIPSGA